MSDDLVPYLQRPLAPVDPALLIAIGSGPMDPADAVALSDLDRLLDPAPLAVETGWCTLPDGVGYVAVRTEMPGVSAEMVDWWFDWHPRNPDRYRIWHPPGHRANSLEQPATPGGKPHWGAVHHPVEDVGVGMLRARIEFRRPSEVGFSTDALDLPQVGTVVAGFAGDDARRAQSTVMVHVFLNERSGLVLRSHFWLGAAIRPYGALGAAGQLLLNNRLARRVLLPSGLPPALARHCCEEYANLAGLLPELYTQYGATE